MNIPHLGRLFRDHETEIRESELIVFIRPELVYDCEICHPREDMARENCETNLDRIPHAEDVQFIPYCQDKNCPYHLSEAAHQWRLSGLGRHRQSHLRQIPVRPFPKRNQHAVQLETGGSAIRSVKFATGHSGPRDHEQV